MDRVVVMIRGHKMADGTIGELRRLAGIRPRLRFRLAGGLRAVANAGDPWANWQRLAGDVLEIACEEDEIAALLRGLPSGAQDVDIVRPGLDAVYAAFLGDEAAP